jgi:hypothetical protein
LRVLVDEIYNGDFFEDGIAVDAGVVEKCALKIVISRVVGIQHRISDVGDVHPGVGFTC